MQSYRVIHQGEVVASFLHFCDAWLHAFFLRSFSHIIGPEGFWYTVNPKMVN